MIDDDIILKILPLLSRHVYFYLGENKGLNVVENDIG